MREKRGRPVLLMLVLLLANEAAVPVSGQEQNELTVTAKASVPSAAYVPASKDVTAKLTAEAKNTPTGSSGITIEGPSWTWTYKVEFASEEGEWGAPPETASYSVMIDPPPPDNPSETTLRVCFTDVGYWRVTDLKATVGYMGGGQTWSASGVAEEVKVTVVDAKLSPNPVYVCVGATAEATVVITPSGAASEVSYDTENAAVAMVVGGAPTLTVTGVASGTTQLRAKLGNDVLATTDVRVVGLSYTPDRGPVLTKIAFQTDASGIFSSSTTLKFDGVFTPVFYDPEPVTVAHSGGKIRYDLTRPDEVAIAVGDVFPAEFVNSTKPALAMALPGTVQGQVRITSGTIELTTEVTFEVEGTAIIGLLGTDGVVEAADIPVYTATSTDDFVGIDPEILMHVELVRPINEFTQNPPQTLTVRVQSFREDGSPLTAGINVTLQRVATTATEATYRTTKGLVFVKDASFEGDQGEALVVAGANGCSPSVIRLPP